MLQATYLTSEGLKKLQDELAHLTTVRRREIAERFQQSRERGGTVSNAEYEEANNERSFNEGRIRALEGMINNAVIIDEEVGQRDSVEVGATVTVKNRQGKRLTYTITGSAEGRSRPGQDLQRLPHGEEPAGEEGGRGRRGIRPFRHHPARNHRHQMSTDVNARPI